MGDIDALKHLGAARRLATRDDSRLAARFAAGMPDLFIYFVGTWRGRFAFYLTENVHFSGDEIA